MTHSQFLPIARRELQKLGFVVEEIPVRASIDRKSPDFNVIGKSSSYLVELKVKGDDPAELDRDRQDLEAGKIVMKATPVGPRNTLDKIISDGSEQMDVEDPSHSKFHLLWLHSWGRDAKFLHERFRATLFGSVQVVYPPNIAPTCYYFYDSSFFELRETLDAAIVSFEGNLQFCVNTLSSRLDEFRKSELYQALLEGLCDPDVEEKSRRGFIADCSIDRRNSTAVLEYLKEKYGVSLLLDLNFTKHSTMIAAS